MRTGAGRSPGGVSGRAGAGVAGAAGSGAALRMIDGGCTAAVGVVGAGTERAEPGGGGFTRERRPAVRAGGELAPGTGGSVGASAASPASDEPPPGPEDSAGVRATEDDEAGPSTILAPRLRCSRERVSAGSGPES